MANVKTRKRRKGIQKRNTGIENPIVHDKDHAEFFTIVDMK